MKRAVTENSNRSLGWRAESIVLQDIAHAVSTKTPGGRIDQAECAEHYGGTILLLTTHKGRKF